MHSINISSLPIWPKVVHGIRAYLTPVRRLTPKTMKVQLRYLKLKMTEVVSCEEQNICIGLSTSVSTQVPSMFAQQMVKSLSELCVPEVLHASAIERLQHLVLGPISLPEMAGQLVHLDIYELEVDIPIRGMRAKVSGMTPFFVPRCMENIYTPTPVDMVFWNDHLRPDDLIARGVRAYVEGSTGASHCEMVVLRKTPTAWKRVSFNPATASGRGYVESTPADVENTPADFENTLADVESSGSIKLKLKLRYCQGIVIDTRDTFVMGEVTGFKECTIGTPLIRFEKRSMFGKWLQKVLTDMEVPSYMIPGAVSELIMILALDVTYSLRWIDCLTQDVLAYLDMYDGNLILPHPGCLDEPDEPLEIPECLLNDPDCRFWF